MPMKPITQALQWIEQQRDTMEQLLCEWVEINSHTFNFSGNEAMLHALKTAFGKLDCYQEIIPVEPYRTMNDQGEMIEKPIGSILYLTSHHNAANKKVLLCGHMDTVYPQNDTFQHAKYFDSKQLSGPGVADMKSGLIIMLYSLLALQKFEINPNISWQVVINADEEIGSPCSTSWIKRCAENSDLGLVFEPALDKAGTMVSERKGSAKYTITAQGKAAHAGRAIHMGRNAIVALAEVIQHVDALNNGRSGLTINVGQVSGGKSLNIVPDFALCRIDVRCEEFSDLEWLENQMRLIFQKVTEKTEVKLTYHQDIKRHPKPMTPAMQKLIELTTGCAKQLNMNLSWEKSGGCTDGNTMAMVNIPAIDSLGGCGERIHSPDEKLFIESLVQRTQLATLLLASL